MSLPRVTAPNGCKIAGPFALGLALVFVALRALANHAKRWSNWRFDFGPNNISSQPGKIIPKHARTARNG